MRCLIDCGAATTLGDYRIFGAMSLKRKIKDNITLNTLTGSRKISEEVIVGVPSEFNRNRETMSVKLIDLGNRNFDCIIGNNVLMPMGVIIDFLNMRLLIEDAVIFLHPNRPQIRYDDITVLEIQNMDLCHVNVPEYIHTEEEIGLNKFLCKYKNTFYLEGQSLPMTTDVKHTIITTSHKPIYSKIYRYPKIHEKEIERQIKEMLE